MKTSITKFIQMIQVLDFIDNIFENGIRFIQKTNDNKDEVRKLIIHYFIVKKIIQRDLNEFTDEMINDIEYLFDFVFLSLLNHIENIDNWKKFKCHLQTAISYEMEEMKNNVKEYEYISKYNHFKEMIELMEEFIFTYPLMEEYEITENAKIYIAKSKNQMIMVN
jgi:hypothetical protein